MPSCLPGFQSGGQPMVSGNPYGSGFPVPTGGVSLKVAPQISGVIWVGVAVGRSSGGVAGDSLGGNSGGGALSSGGISDGWLMRNGDEFFIPSSKCSGNLNKIHFIVPAAISGTIRVYWDAQQN